jgi:hypothetical protein
MEELAELQDLAPHIEPGDVELLEPAGVPEHRKNCPRFILPWVVDECPNDSGHWTIRFADGSPNGDTDRQPIATVYDLYIAEKMVEIHNALVTTEGNITVSQGVMTFENGDEIAF